jgi:hypothetical protein
LQNHHWLLLLIVFLVGYVFARFYPQLGAKVGLP